MLQNDAIKCLFCTNIKQKNTYCILFDTAFAKW